MSLGKSLKSMDFMTNAVESTETQMFGNISLTFSIISQSLLPLIIPYIPEDFLLFPSCSACMVVFLLLSIPLTISDNLIVFRKYLMKVQCAISFGQILMRRTDGVSPKEELVTHLDRIFLNSLSITTS